MQWDWKYAKRGGQGIGKVGQCTFTFALAQKVRILTPVLAKAKFLLHKRPGMQVFKKRGRLHVEKKEIWRGPSGTQL